MPPFSGGRITGESPPARRLHAGGRVGSVKGSPVAVVSYGFWRRRLGSDAHIVGRGLKLNGHLYTVTGVLPRDYRSILGHGVSPEVYVIAPPDSGQTPWPKI